jgi:hypothetical protein
MGALYNECGGGKEEKTGENAKVDIAGDDLLWLGFFTPLKATDSTKVVVLNAGFMTGLTHVLRCSATFDIAGFILVIAEVATLLFFGR